MPRSLTLSADGQQQARQALERCNLTQKAIAEERGVASWSTVNRFFNGRPVDRLIFQEICHVLELEWEDVVQAPNSTSNHSPITSDKFSTTPIPASLQSQTRAAREALTPRILQRIPRAVVQEKYLPAIQRGLTDDKIRIVAIVGPAGYGKSTILGNIYDELEQPENWGAQWVGLILCASLVMPSQPTADELAMALGQSLIGEDRNLIEIAAELTEHQGRGVLLVDTLDLVLNRSLVIVLTRVLRDLVAHQVNVVFTCRDHEYQDLLEPTREKLPGLVANLDRHSLQGFTTSEIQQVTVAFFQATYPDQPERGTVFAQQILQLSTDNRSLQSIIENPLLLALLCDLFAADGQVPYDLTVSKLYERYWYEKVTYYRGDGSHTGGVAIGKETLCLTIAQTLFDLSDYQLQEALYLDELPLDLVPPLDIAYDDLLSEGVLDHLPHRRLHFFHQTLLEYALAYWLTRRSARSQQQQLFEKLKNNSHDSYTWLPVVRQLLTIVGTQAEFDALVEQLALENLGIFTAVAYAAASRDQPDALENLLPTALDLGELYQQRLRQALSIASRPLVEQTWDLLLRVLTEAEHVTAGNTAQLVGSLLERWWLSLWPRLPDTLATIAQRSQDDAARLYGWLLYPCWSHLQGHPEALAAVRQISPLLGHGACAKLIGLHTSDEISPQAQCQLLRLLLEQPVLNYPDIAKALTDFVAFLLPRCLSAPEFPLGSRWDTVLDGEWPDRWDLVQVKAVGRWAANDLPVLIALFDRLLFGESRYIQRTLAALTESVNYGAGPELVDYLVQLPPDRMLVFSRFNAVLLQSVPQLSPERQEAFVQWLIDHVGDGKMAETQVRDLADVLNSLADESLTARSYLTECLPHLPKRQRQHIETKLLRFQPIEAHPPLPTFNKSGQRFLLMEYQKRAAANSLALDKLLGAAQLKSKDVAISASHALAQVSGLMPSQILFLLESGFTGVRVNGVRILAHLDEAEQPLSAIEVDHICRVLKAESDQAVTRHLCDLLSAWVKREQQVPKAILQTLVAVPNRLVQKSLFDGGTARSLMAVLKVIAQSEVTTVDIPLLGDVVRQLVLSIHIVQIRNGESELLDVLCAVQRLDAEFLSSCVAQDCAGLVAKGWERNVSAILKAIQRVDGATSDLFDTVRASDWCTPGLSSLILAIRAKI